MAKQSVSPPKQPNVVFIMGDGTHAAPAAPASFNLDAVEGKVMSATQAHQSA